MARLACVSLINLKLQILLRENSCWESHPVAVVSTDTPLGEVLQVNEIAYTAGVKPGLRFGTALSLCPTLMAQTVGQQRVRKALEALLGILKRFSPDVEQSEDYPGVFWLNGSGLKKLYATPKKWATQIQQAVKEADYSATISVGFSKFGTYATARNTADIIILKSIQDELQVAQKTPIHFLDFSPSHGEALKKLGVFTLKEFAGLPSEGLLRRFGKQVQRLHRLASAKIENPLLPKADNPVISQRRQLEEPDDNAHRLTFLAKQALFPLLKQVATNGLALESLVLKLLLDHAPSVTTVICPAAPTLDEGQLADLIRLKLVSLSLPAGVVEIILTAQTVLATPRQLQLFADYDKRSIDAANRALARLKAAYGENAVTVAVVKEGHLPEAQFDWIPLKKLALPKPKEISETTTFVRRIYKKPIPLNTRPVRGPKGVHLNGLEHAPVLNADGPFIVSGGWWQKEVHREYHFAKTEDGKILWIYFDRRRRRWFLQGMVE